MRNLALYKSLTCLITYFSQHRMLQNAGIKLYYRNEQLVTDALYSRGQRNDISVLGLVLVCSFIQKL